VQFCCPYCNQSYYGTDHYGHLVPAAFDCTACGQRIHMDEMVLLPAAGLEEDQTRIENMPWLERRKRGFFRSWFSTIGRAMVRPGRLMRSLPLGGSAASAWWFAIFTNTLILLCALAPICVLQILMLRMFGAMGGGGGPGLVAFGAGLAIAFVGAIVALIVGIALWGLIAHGLLRLTGPTAAPLGRTCQAVCYSSGANAPTALPFVGLYLGWIWWIVSAVLMAKEAQRVQGWRAALAVLTFPAFLLFTIIGFYAVLIFMVFSAVGPFASAALTPSAETQVVLRAMLDYAEEHAGRGPDHAIELVSGDYLAVDDVVTWDSETYIERVPMGGLTLDQFDSLSADRRTAAVRTAISALPATTVGHRLGDFVFTHHGMDLDSPDPDLWLVIMSADPAVNTPPAPEDELAVGRADGTVQVITAASFDAGLGRQNDLRAKYGLRPLPPPASVTHAKPALAQP
jgi:hypothetical protein